MMEFRNGISEDKLKQRFIKVLSNQTCTQVE